MANEQLREILEQINTVYAELVDLGGVKKEQLIQNRLNELTVTLSKETKLIKKLQELEQRRTGAVAALQKEIGISADPNMPLTQLSRYTPAAADKLAFEKLSGDLTGHVQALKALNQLNQQLIKQGLGMVEHSLDLLSGGPVEEFTYKAPSQVLPGVKRNGIFDSKA